MFRYPRGGGGGGSRGTNLLVSFGMKFDIMFKKISANVLTCYLGSVFRCWGHGKQVMLLLIAAEFALLKCQIFLSNGNGVGWGGGGGF